MKIIDVLKLFQTIPFFSAQATAESNEIGVVTLRLAVFEQIRLFHRQGQGQGSE